jgi:lysophospholipase L1-like esterase
MGGGQGAGTYDTPTTSPLTRADGFFPWANISLGGRLTLSKNAGVGGNTSAQILARITDVTGLAAMPGYCILADCASNDLIANTASATIITNLQAICDALQAKGITVVLCTVLPIAGTSAHVQRQEEVNRWIRGRDGLPGFIICDWAARWADPTTGGPKTGFATDGIHPTPLGAGAIGRVLAEALRSRIGGSIELASQNLDQLHINLNPMMVGTSGTASTGTSGQVATDWIALRGSGSGTMACSKVARNPIDGVGGEWQKIELAGGGGAFFLYSDVASAGISGQKLQVELEFEEADFSGITDFRITCDTLAGAAGLGLYQLAASALPVDISSGVIRSPETFTIPVGGPFTIRTLLYIQGTAGSAKVSRFRTRKVA